MSSGIYIYISTIIPLHQLTGYGPVYGYIQERCGKPMELEGTEPIINTLPHLSQHQKGIREKERFWLEERRKRVRGYDRVPGREELHNCVDLRNLENLAMANQITSALQAGRLRIIARFTTIIMQCTRTA
jgi:hypothetical protein